MSHYGKLGPAVPLAALVFLFVLAPEADVGLRLLSARDRESGSSSARSEFLRLFEDASRLRLDVVEAVVPECQVVDGSRRSRKSNRST